MGELEPGGSVAWNVSRPTRGRRALGATLAVAGALVIVIVIVPSVASADECGEMQTNGTMDAVCADGKILRGTLGFQVARLHGLEKTPGREGLAFSARVDMAVISAFVGAPRFGESGFLLHDAFDLDLALGAMTSDPIDPGPALGSDRKEGRQLALASFGYLALAGWAFPKASIAAGVDFAWSSQFFGSTSSTDLLNGTRSIMLRGSFAGFVASAWKGALLGGDDRIGGEVDLPISSRPLWIALRFDALPNQSYDLPLGAGANTSNGSTWAATIGLRACGSWAICR